MRLENLILLTQDRRAKLSSVDVTFAQSWINPTRVGRRSAWMAENKKKKKKRLACNIKRATFVAKSRRYRRPCLPMELQIDSLRNCTRLFGLFTFYYFFLVSMVGVCTKVALV